MEKADIVHRVIAKAIDLILVGMMARLLPFGILAAGLYILISDGFFQGQSIGKKLIGLRVVLTAESQTKNCSFRHSIIRNLPYAVVIILGSIPIFGWFVIFPLGVVFLLLEAYFVYADDQGVRIGDIYAGTQVVDDAQVVET